MRQTAFTLLFVAVLGVSAAAPSCPTEPQDLDGDGLSVAEGDCDDADPGVNPGVIETCDGRDEDCDGVVDDGFDGDGDGRTLCGGDCDDTNGAVSPDLTETCDGHDEDCDGSIDEGFDADGDGSRTCDGDCDDTSLSVGPAAAEACGGGDEDCDGATDEGFDLDGDGATSCGGDCDDHSPDLSPLLAERCDEVDNDCDGATDEGFDLDHDGATSCDGDCDDTDAAVYSGAVEACDQQDEDCDGRIDEGFDADRDGFTSCAGDCADTDPTRKPGAAELCDAVDQDCDTKVDEGFDADHDGVTSCGGDCADGDPTRKPGATEACDAVDQDCDAKVDEGFDKDTDAWTTCAGDCNDASAAIHPGALETCSSKDEDCDAKIDEGFDTDKDGYTTCGGDCDDTKATVNPSVYEGANTPSTTTDGRDNDCDGYVDIDCDGTSGTSLPRVTLSSPSRGLFTTTSSVSLAGLVLPATSRSPVTTVTIEGGSGSLQRCSADGGARFTGSRSLTRGLTTLRVTARDAAGVSDKAESSVAYSSRFIPIRSQAVSGALVAELNQGSWNILADYLETFLVASEMEDELVAANPIIHQTGSDDCLTAWELYGEATDYNHQDVQVTFTISGGKIKSTAKIVRPEMWVDGWAWYDLEWFCGGWSDSSMLAAYARFSDVTATADAGLSMGSDGQLKVSFTNVLVAANGPYLEVDSDSSIYDWMLDLYEDDMAAAMEGFVEDQLHDYVVDSLGPLLAAELNELDLSYDIAVGSKTYGVALDIASVVVPTGTVDVGLSMDLDYVVDSRIPSNPGALGHANTYSRTTSPTVAFKVGMDFFNAAFHALWEGGSLHLQGQLEDNPPIWGSADPRLPPVVVPATGSYQMELAVADVMTTVEITGSGGVVERLTASVSARVPLKVTPKVDDTSLWFEATFGTAALTFDVVSEQAISPQLQAQMEAGLSEMITRYLDELEVYIESLEISYLALPLTLSAVSVAPDTSNPAMLTVSGTAAYSGP